MLPKIKNEFLRLFFWENTKSPFESIWPLDLNNISNKSKSIEYWKYSSFNKFLMPRSLELNNWAHAKKGDLPHVTCLQDDIKQESSLADEKCLQKIFLLAQFFFAYKNDVKYYMLDFIWRNANFIARLRFILHHLFIIL